MDKTTATELVGSLIIEEQKRMSELLRQHIEIEDKIAKCDKRATVLKELFEDLR